MADGMIVDDATWRRRPDRVHIPIIDLWRPEAKDPFHPPIGVRQRQLYSIRRPKKYSLDHSIPLVRVNDYWGLRIHNRGTIDVNG